MALVEWAAGWHSTRAPLEPGLQMEQAGGHKLLMGVWRGDGGHSEVLGRGCGRGGSQLEQCRPHARARLQNHASSHLSEPEKQEGLQDVIAERAGVLGQTALGSNPGHASY